MPNISDYKQKNKEQWLRHQIHRVILHQNGHPDMLTYWYGEANKKEMIIDAIRDIVKGEHVGPFGTINHLCNDFIFKGIVMRKNQY